MSKNHYVRGAREHVSALFRGVAEREALEYHHIARTLEIVDACKEIAKGSEVDDESRGVAVLCAWFYDSCYATGSDDHAKSMELCLEFLERLQPSPVPSEQVVACFRDVNLVEGAAPGAPDAAPPQHQVTASDILHDARLAVLARSDYVEQIELLRFELQRRSGRAFSDVEWTQHCVGFLSGNAYRTPFAQSVYGAGRAANLARLQKRLRKHLRQVEEERADGESSAAKRIAKSAESVFYHFTRIQMGMVAIADHRTSTMIHVNAIMLSIVVALLGRRIQTHWDFLVPTIMMLVVNLTVVFLSMHSLRMPRSRVSRDEARAREQNVLAFGNEVPMSLVQYTEQMGALFADPPVFQRRVLEHLYFTRDVLVQRGKTLRLTYDVFMYGIALAVLAFIVVILRQ